jgi:hypothetical protein
MATMTIETSPDTENFPAAESTCGCGQALELFHKAHCPRCGVTLRG